LPQQNYNIQKIIFSVEVNAKEKAYELQNRISRIVNDSLLNCVDSFLNKNIADDFVLKINRLVIDIGEIEEDYLEQDIISRFIEHFCNEISAAILLLNSKQFHFKDGIYSEPTFQNKLKLLEHFLLTGVLLWWAEKMNNFLLDETIEELIKSKTNLLRELFYRLGKNEAVRKRLAYQFKIPTVKSIIEVLEPSEAAFIFSYYEEIQNIQLKEQVIKSETTGFARATLLFILNYILADRGGVFNRKEFVKSNIRQIADNFNIDYSELLQLFFDSINKEITFLSSNNSLQWIIKQLYNEAILSEKEDFFFKNLAPQDGQQEKSNFLSRWVEAFRYFLFMDRCRYGWDFRKK